MVGQAASKAKGSSLFFSYFHRRVCGEGNIVADVVTRKESDQSCPTFIFFVCDRHRADELYFVAWLVWRRGAGGKETPVVVTK